MHAHREPSLTLVMSHTDANSLNRAANAALELMQAKLDESGVSGPTIDRLLHARAQMQSLANWTAPK